MRKFLLLSGLLFFISCCSDGNKKIKETHNEIDDVNKKADSIDKNLEKISRGLDKISSDSTGYNFQ